MGKVKVELISKGMKELLRSGDIESYLNDLGADYASRCGSGYSHDTKLMETRYIGSYYTDTYEAMKDNLENNTLLRTL